MAREFPSRRVAVVRELTKLHEEVLRGTLAEVAEEVARREVLGEIVVVLEGGAPAAAVDEEVLSAALGEAMAGGATLRDAVAGVVDAFGVAHRETYELALRLRAGGAT